MPPPNWLADFGVFTGARFLHAARVPSPLSTSRILARLVPVLLGLLLATNGRGEHASAFQVWTVDPLVKVFRDATPSSGDASVMEVARGECATWQVVVRSSQSLQNLRAEITPFHRRWSGAKLMPKAPRFVGYVPVDRPTQRPSRDQLRPPPADYPDPLLEVTSTDLAAAQAQPIWITLPVALQTRPGVYHAKLRLEAAQSGRTIHVDQRLVLVVHPAAAGPAPLWVTDWYGLQWQHMAIHPQPESDESYALLRRYARNMAEHRHNVALIPPLALADFSVDGQGKLAIQFARFDRWVRIFQEEGVIGRIEGGHIGGRKEGWLSEFVVTTHAVEDGKVVAHQVAPDSPAADVFYARFFPALVAHLKEQNWLGLYLQHLADEPIPENIASYRAMAALARKYAPELRIIEACHTKDLVGSIDVWVPQLNYLHQDWAHYQARQRAGEEVWFYTCVYPQGEYANRFIEQPLLKTRLLHWINARYGVTGYLHWGYNQWTADSPFTHTTRPHGGPPYLPAGDPWIVYPGKNGPLDSIRFEAMRDGIADVALLSSLAQVDPQAAQSFTSELILDFDKYSTDLARFRQVRRALLQRLDHCR